MHIHSAGKPRGGRDSGGRGSREVNINGRIPYNFGYARSYNALDLYCADFALEQIAYRGGLVFIDAPTITSSGRINHAEAPLTPDGAFNQAAAFAVNVEECSGPDWE